jgi:tyrosyl-DNA phosphodiesterase-1
VSPHIKTVFRLAAPGASRELCWLYVGSHNLSKSAWGEVQRPPGAAFVRPQLRVASFELGVLFLPRLVGRVAGRPVRLLLGQGNAADHPAPGEIVMPVPYRFPAEQYTASLSGQERLDDMPWTWDVAYQQRDSLGDRWFGIHAKQ